jgi:hypothetical protein
MPLKATVSEAEFSELHKSIHDEYEKQDDGTYRLKLLSDYESKDAITGLKSALDKERENAKNASTTLSKLREQFGDVDVEKYQEMIAAESQREEEAALKRGEYDKQLATVNEKHGQELQKQKDREQALIDVIRKSKIDAEVVSALNKLGGNVNLLQPHVQRQMQLIEEDGVFQSRVVDDAGTVRVNGEGKFMTTEELVSEMRDQETFATAFTADVKSGGGTPAGDGSQNGDGKKGVIPSDLKRSTMETRQKVEFIREHGNDEYQKLPI